jgi:acetyl esterase/lipase
MRLEMSKEVKPAAEVTLRLLKVKGAQRELEARLYTPRDADGAGRNGMIVFFPSGGFVADELEESDECLRALALCTGFRVLGSSYTLAGEQPFPAAVEDAHAVLNWAGRHCMRKGKKGPLVVMGIEAGGNLAAVASLMARDRGGPALAAQVLIMPMLDAGLTSCSMRQLAMETGAANQCAAGYRGYLPRATDRDHPYASPLRSSRLKGLPPALILSADDDPLRDEAELYGAKLAAAKVPSVVRRLPPIALQEPDARCSCARQEEALQEIAAFIATLNA